MGWRFRKRIKIFPGFYINISKSGLGVNIGPKGANVSVGPNGTYVNTGIPGTGLYRRDKVDSSIHNSTEIQQESHNYRKQEVTLNVGKEEQQYGGSVVSQLNTHHTPVNQKDSHSEISYGDISMPYDPKRDLENYQYPTIDLLKKYDYDGTLYVDMEEQNANKNRIVDTLRNFGIEISSIKATVGARITLYEISLAPGVNASKLRGLEDDIALALSSHNVQILIPIPGKGTIGIEVPNIRPSVVPYANDVDMTHLDPLFEEAARLIVKEQRCSCGLIMRKFAIGYNRVVRLMNQLEKARIVGVSYGSTLRDVLITDDRTLEYILSHWRQ